MSTVRSGEHLLSRSSPNWPVQCQNDYMWFIGIIVFAFVVSLLIGIALHPVRFLVNSVRVILFLIALGTTFVYFVERDNLSESSRTDILWLMAAMYGAWMLTLFLPWLVRVLCAMRSRE